MTDEGYLLDTNVVSEFVKPRPEPRVFAWLADVDEERVFLSVASFAEIRFGVERMPEGRRRAHLAEWLTDDLPTRFAGRILDADRSVADAWGRVVARAQRAGVTVSAMDAFFAATAEVRALTLVTRNVRDFAKLGIPLLDPWDEPSLP